VSCAVALEAKVEVEAGRTFVCEAVHWLFLVLARRDGRRIC
jgi:hypothetical protein